MTDMTISDIRVIPLRVPWVDPPVFGKARVTAPRDILVVEIETKGGLVGLGYLHLLSPSLRTIAACLDEAIVPLLIGRDATAIEAIWRDLWRTTYTAGRMGIAVMAISAIDIALWDLVGKEAGMPLHRLWGHFRSEIPAYGSGCWRGLGGDGMIEKALGYVTQGYSAIKMQVAHIHDRHADLTNVRRMREAVGPEIEIMIDVNMGWTADVALQMGRKFQDYDVYWLEEPVPAEDFAGYLRLADALDLRIVGGETHFTRYDLRPFLENPKLPILQPDVMRGGLTELRKIAALADTWGMSLAPHLFPELMVQVMASIPNGIWLEQMGWLDDLWVESVPVVAGMIRAPERPGHGLAFKPEVLRDHRILRI
jgi:L-alanine-DL-glutamate epimerase-like enolase superfamily enzyme